MSETEYRLRDRQIGVLQRIAGNLSPTWVNRGLMVAIALAAADTVLIAKIQSSSALAIVRHSSLLTLALGVSINIAPTLLQAVVLACAFLIAANAEHNPQFAWKRFEYGIGATVALVLLVPESALIVSIWLLFALPLIGFAVAWAMERGRVGISIDQQTLFVVIGVLAIFSVVASPGARDQLMKPWLPPERVELQAKPDFIGYVLDVDQSGDWTTLLRDSNRQVEVVHSESILSRTPCILSKEASKPSWVLGDSPKNSEPAC